MTGAIKTSSCKAQSVLFMLTSSRSRFDIQPAIVVGRAATPNGETRQIGKIAIKSMGLDDLKPFHLHTRTPLWFYVLREAEVTHNGERLGPVGGRIVAEVMVGLIQGDGQSYLRQEPDWTPTYGPNGSFATVDLLKAADVVAAL